MKRPARFVLILSLVLPFFSSHPGFGAVSLNIAGDLSHVYTLDPGGRVKARITIENQGDEEGEVKVYLQDYLHYADGRNLFQKPGTIHRSNASWIQVSPNQASIPPKGTLTVEYALSVPAEPSLKGTYWSLIVVEPVPKALLSPKAPEDEVNMNVITVTRFALQVITTLGRTGTASLRFSDRRLVREEKRRLLELDLENSGERLLSPHVWAELFNDQGQPAGQFDGSRARIYPGGSFRFQLDLSALAPGAYKAVVVADNGDENVFGANYTLELK